MEVDELVARVTAGEARAVARLISWVEDGAPELARALAALPAGPSAYIIGLTGSPGVGKSTVTSALVGAFRAANLELGIAGCGCDDTRAECLADLDRRRADAATGGERHD